jgi:hypothetical protein
MLTYCWQSSGPIWAVAKRGDARCRIERLSRVLADLLELAGDAPNRWLAEGVQIRPVENYSGELASGV